ncbi:hypothetical protein Q3G72_015175 [Acer saccharum]|nr:hypothetical protein Q3G72_015175 [Acer saccharum]
METSSSDGGGVYPLTVMEHCEEERKLSEDGDKALQMDSYKSEAVAASPVTFSLNFENVAEKAEHSGKRCGSRLRDVPYSLLAAKDSSLVLNSNSLSISEKSFNVDLGQEDKCRGEGPSEVKQLDEVVIEGPLSEISSNIMGSAPIGTKAVLGCPSGLFQADRSELTSGCAAVVCGVFFSWLLVFFWAVGRCFVVVLCCLLLFVPGFLPPLACFQ